MKHMKMARCMVFALVLTVAAAMFPVIGAQSSVSYGAASKTKLSAPKNFKAVSGGAHAVKLSWSKVKTAKGYKIYKYNKETKKYKKVKTLSSAKKTKWTEKGLQADRVQKYRVRAYKKVKGKTVNGKISYTVSAKPQTNKSKTKNVKRIYMDRSLGGLYPGFSQDMWAFVEPDEDVVSEKLVWSTSNSKVAKVKKGVMTATGFGTAYITARAHNGVTAKCKVTVKKIGAEVNGKTIYLGEKVASVNSKFGKPYIGNLKDSELKELVGNDKSFKVYTYGTVGEPAAIVRDGRVYAFAATDGSSFDVRGVKDGEAKSTAAEKKLRGLWEETEYVEDPDLGNFYVGNNEDYTTELMINMQGGHARGFAIGSVDVPAVVAYYLVIL